MILLLLFLLIPNLSFAKVLPLRAEGALMASPTIVVGDEINHASRFIISDPSTHRIGLAFPADADSFSDSALFPFRYPVNANDSSWKLHFDWHRDGGLNVKASPIR